MSNILIIDGVVINKDPNWSEQEALDFIKNIPVPRISDVTYDDENILSDKEFITEDNL